MWKHPPPKLSPLRNRKLPLLPLLPKWQFQPQRRKLPLLLNQLQLPKSKIPFRQRWKPQKQKRRQQKRRQQKPRQQKRRLLFLRRRKPPQGK
jgi:hypothetical protein